MFCQNPSIVLTTLICALRGLCNYSVCIDRHSNFKLETASSKNPKWQLFHLLSKWTVRNAELTIVTNPHSEDLVQKWGGRPYILQDKLPHMEPSGNATSPDFMREPQKNQIMFVTTFSDDEPIEEVFEAAEKVNDSVFYLTGNYSKKVTDSRRADLAKRGIVLTGFVGDQEYTDLMSRADIVVVLTTKQNLLTCGAYEALALRKPMVLSNTEALRDYFSKGAIYVEPKCQSIADGINLANAQKKMLADEVAAFVPALEAGWHKRFQGLLVTLGETMARYTDLRNS